MSGMERAWVSRQRVILPGADLDGAATKSSDALGTFDILMHIQYALMHENHYPP